MLHRVSGARNRSDLPRGEVGRGIALDGAHVRPLGSVLIAVANLDGARATEGEVGAAVAAEGLDDGGVAAEDGEVEWGEAELGAAVAVGASEDEDVEDLDEADYGEFEKF